MSNGWRQDHAQPDGGYRQTGINALAEPLDIRYEVREVFVKELKARHGAIERIAGWIDAQSDGAF